jgi:hypothetical protein
LENEDEAGAGDAEQERRATEGAEQVTDRGPSPGCEQIRSIWTEGSERRPGGIRSTSDEAASGDERKNWERTTTRTGTGV